MTTKLSDYVFRFVADRGVRHVFLLPGGGAMHLVDSLGRCADLEFVACNHEQAAALAAEAYGKYTNNLGVALVTTGPGGTNAVTGVLGAWQDSTPTLFISGQVKRSDLMAGRGVRQMGVQEADIVALVSSITKYAVTVTEPESLRFHLEKAYHLATTGRPGPVWIDIPLDVQAAMIDPEALPGCAPPAREPDPTLPEKVARAIELLNEADRPLALFGNGVRLARAQAEMGELIERAGVPVECTWSDLIPQDHPLFVGRPGSYAPRGANFALQNSDFLLCVGARLDLSLVGFSYRRFARAAQKVLVDIDPAELAKIDTPVAVSICADAGEVLREFLRQAGSIARRDRSPWLARCADWKARYPFILPEYSQGEGLVSVYHLSDTLVDQLAPADVIVCGSSGMAIEVFITAFRAKPGQRVLHTAGLGAMGCALPACLGAALASGKRTVVVDGDGGFQLNIQELATLARLNLPVKYFVVNNGGYASIRAMQNNRFGGHLVAADASSGVSLPDITAVAAAYGLTTRRIEGQADVGEGVAEVLATPGTVLCEVRARPDETRQPTLAARQLPDGSMVSNPLEDLSPLLSREEFLANMIVPPVEA